MLTLFTRICLVIIFCVIDIVFLMLIAKKLKMNNPYLVWVPLAKDYLQGVIVAQIRNVGSGIKWLFFSLGCLRVIFLILLLKVYMNVYLTYYAKHKYLLYSAHSAQSAQSAQSANVATSYLSYLEDQQNNTLLLCIIMGILFIIILVISIIAIIQLGMALKDCGYSTSTAVLVMLFVPFLWSLLVYNRLDDLLKERELEQWILKQKYAESERKKLQQRQLEQQQLRQLQQQEQKIW